MTGLRTLLRVISVGAALLMQLNLAHAELPCVLVQSTCVDGPSTKRINGLDVFRQCWQYSNTYECGGIAALNPDCSVLRGQGCGQIGSITCAQAASDGSCDIYASSYQCTTVPTTTQLVMCGGNTFCADGSCADTSYVANTGFTQSYGGLAALEEAAKDLCPPEARNPDGTCSTFSIFTGVDMRCENDLNIRDCCDMDGILNGVISCSQEEELLARERRDGKTIRVGTYCSDRVSLGIGSICVEETTTFCDYKSVLGRIIMEQGKPQLGLNFGSSRNPDCSGFTPDQFAMLNFNAIDFSEFTNQFAVPAGDLTGAMANLQANLAAGTNPPPSGTGQ